MTRIDRGDKGRGPRCQQNRSSALSGSPSALPSPVVGASSPARLWYWVWRLSAFPPVEATLDAEGDTGAGLKRRFPCCSKTIFSRVFGAGAKTHFQKSKSPPWVGGVLRTTPLRQEDRLHLSFIPARPKRSCNAGLCDRHGGNVQHVFKGQHVFVTSVNGVARARVSCGEQQLTSPRRYDNVDHIPEVGRGRFRN